MDLQISINHFSLKLQYGRLVDHPRAEWYQYQMYERILMYCRCIAINTQAAKVITSGFNNAGLR